MIPLARFGQSDDGNVSCPVFSDDTPDAIRARMSDGMDYESKSDSFMLFGSL